MAADLALLLLSLACLWLGPRLVDGYAARQWARYHAVHGATAQRPLEDLRGAVRAAERVLDRAAPLPWASQAVRDALALARRLEAAQPQAAQDAYASLSVALARARASRWRGLGLGSLAEETARLERAARARSRAGGA